MPKKELEDIIKPWEKSDDESSLEFQAFVIYRDMKPEDRSYSKVAQLLTKTKVQIGEWGAKFHWQDRVSAWERELDRVKLKKRAEDIEKMSERHAGQAQAISRAAFIPVEALLKNMSSPEWPKTLAKLQKLPPLQLIEYAKAVASVMPTIMKMERLARGETTEESRVSGNFSAKIVDRKEYQVNVSDRIDQYADAIREALRYGPPTSDASSDSTEQPVHTEQSTPEAGDISGTST
jgi:hypothetical protein